MHRSWNPTSGMNTGLPPRLRLDARILLSPASGKQGQSLVELALVLPLLVVLVIGAVEIGRAAYYSIAITNAARSAVQYGMQSPIKASDNVGIIQAALNDAPMLNPADIVPKNFCECPDGFVPTLNECQENPDCCLSHGDQKIDYLQVNTEMQLIPLIGFPGLPPSFSLSGEAIMRVGE